MAKDNGNGKALVEGAAVGLGAGVGAYLGSRRAGPAAPPTDLSALLTLLEDIKTTNEAILAAVKALVLVFPSEILTPWRAKEPELILQQAIRSVIFAAAPLQSDKMVDLRNGKRLFFKVESSLDQPVIIQLVGNQADSFNLSSNVDGPFPCPAGGNIHIGLAWDDWCPYVGVRITAAVAPTVGMLNIWSVMQE